MAVDPNTGRIITSASLTISEADAKRVPRNQALGPSRTAQERKQIRTAMLSAWEGLADNPVIADIIDDLTALEQYLPATYTLDEGVPGYFAVPLPRVEDSNGDPLYYAFTYNAYLTIGGGGSGNMDIEFSFGGNTQSHSIGAYVTTALSTSPTGEDVDFRSYVNSGTGDTFAFTLPYEAGSNIIHINIHGRIAAITEELDFNLLFTASDQPGGLSNGVLTVQLTNDAYV